MAKIIGLVVVILILGFGVWQFLLAPKSSEQLIVETQISPTSSAQTQPTEGQMVAGYKDGTYSATGFYQSPAAREQVDVTITLANGVVTATTFTGHPQSPTTTTMQGKFKAGFEQEVVGKNLDEINLTVVNGSSLTPKGFMDALGQIKTQAASS